MIDNFESILQFLQPKLNYWASIILILIGLFGMIVKRNLIKKLIGLVIFQSAIILFFVSIGVKENSTIPILEHDLTYAHDSEAAHITGEHVVSGKIDADHYSNPLPHVLMLTAIVVGVATLGVALATVEKIYQGFGTLEEDKILDQISRES